MIIYIDIDGVLCPDLHEKFRDAKYRQDCIDFINLLHSSGHKVILWTSRGVKQKDKTALDDTILELNKLGVCFDEIKEKPFYDMIVDDKALNSIDTLKKMFEKFTGETFY